MLKIKHPKENYCCKFYSFTNDILIEQFSAELIYKSSLQMKEKTYREGPSPSGSTHSCQRYLNDITAKRHTIYIGIHWLNAQNIFDTMYYM